MSIFFSVFIKHDLSHEGIVPSEHIAGNSLDNTSVTTNVNGIHALLANLDVAKSPGYDNVHALFPKELVASICSLFNMSLSQGEFPTE